jgi:hypothetical protein
MKPTSPNSEEKGRAVAYLANVFDPAIELPYEIIPGFALRRAADSERDFISQVMHQSSVASVSLASVHEKQIQVDSTSITLTQESDSAKWRYYVIEYPHDEQEGVPRKNDATPRRMPGFELAALVSNARLEWGLESSVGPEPGSSRRFSRPAFVFAYESYMHEFLRRQAGVPVLNAEHLVDIRMVFHVIEKLPDEQQLVVQACQLYQASHNQRLKSPFRILALFAAIEFLVTHKPNPNESGDSLTRQIKSKLPLLCRRFDEPFPPERTFPKAGAKAWEILYAYRSKIAHGGNMDFRAPYKKDGFSELISGLDIAFFLDEFVRRLMRHAIMEPQLCLDLKQC